MSYAPQPYDPDRYAAEVLEVLARVTRATPEPDPIDPYNPSTEVLR